MRAARSGRELLGHEIEELVVEAKRLGIEREEMLESIADTGSG